MATSGYAKLFSSIWGGSIYGKFEASAVFMVFLSLADYDGHVDMTPQGIAGTTGWPLDFIVKGIKELELPDACSRTPAEDGRRIVLLDSHRNWGWNIVNFALYRDKLRSAERRRYLAEKQRERRASQHLSTTVNSVNQVNHPSSSLSTPKSTTESNRKDNGQQVDHDSAFEAFWILYPKHVKRKDAKRVWQAKKLDALLQTIQQDIRERLAFDRRWKENFIPDPTTYLRGERWNDEIDRSVRADPPRRLSAVEIVEQATRENARQRGEIP